MYEQLDFRSWQPKNDILVRIPSSQNSWPLSSSPGNSSLTRSQQGLALTAGHCGIVDLAEKNDLPTYMTMT